MRAPGPSKMLHQHLSPFSPVWSLLTGKEQFRESQRQRLDLREMACFSPEGNENSTKADGSCAHEKPQQGPTSELSDPG